MSELKDGQRPGFPGLARRRCGLFPSLSSFPSKSLHDARPGVVRSGLTPEVGFFIPQSPPFGLA